VVVQSVHHLFRDIYYQIDLFLFTQRSQDIQWYVYDMGEMVTYLMLSTFLYLRESEVIVKRFVFILVCHAVVKIFLYWFCFSPEHSYLMMLMIYFGFFHAIIKN